MRRLILLMIVGMLVGLVAMPANAAKAPKVDLCHWDADAGAYHLINVSANAEQKHRNNHDDGAIGEPVPGSDGYTFGADCQPVQEDDFLVRAISTNPAGDQRVIAELVDTNDDGVPSPGDTAKFYEYPTDFTGNSFSPFGITECVIDYWQQGSDPALRRVHVEASSDPNCEIIYWTERTVAGQEHERFGVWYDGVPPADVDLLDSEGFLGRDWVAVNGIMDPQRLDSTDDSWLDVEFNF